MKLRVLILLLIVSFNIAFAEDNLVQPHSQATQVSLTQPQNVAFEYCTKMFSVNKEKLYYLTLAAVNANKFRLEEIQTENGYIIFAVGKNKYLATISGIDADNSILKITPCNEIYYFPPGIILNMFKYVEMNINTEIKAVP